MKRGRWKLWVAGIALVQLLVLGVDVALLWPSEAERAATLLRLGMTIPEVQASLQKPTEFHRWGDDGSLYDVEFRYIQNDGSTVFVWFGRKEKSNLQVAFSVRTTPAAPIPPLTHLRRILARAFPFLKE